MAFDNTLQKYLSLDEISSRLESFEETIVFKLLDRAQYTANERVYERGKSGFRDAGDLSLLELRLRSQQNIDVLFGKFNSLEERPFFNDDSIPRCKTIMEGNEIVVDNYDAINLSVDIMAAYRSFVPSFCRSGDDGHYGSSVELDVYAMSAISRRIHFGSIYAAECKFKSDPVGFGRLIDACDQKALLDRCTRKDIEDRTIERVREKTKSTQITVNRNIRKMIEPEIIVAFYRQHIIPLTKKGQVLYLLNRNRKRKSWLCFPKPSFFPLWNCFSGHSVRAC